MDNANAWYTAVNAVKTKFDAVTPLLANMVADADAQAALEKAWLEAYYLQQYWAALKATFTEGTGGAKTIAYKLALTNLDDSDAAVTTTTVGATAEVTSKKGALSAGQAALAALESATNDAAAVKAALAARILRADAQINSLDGLSDGATGTLDAAAAKRLKDLNDYKSTTVGSEGESTLATKELSDANDAVKDRTGAATTDGGPLTEGRALAQAAWTLAQ